MKKTININDKLDRRIHEYIKKYNMTYTTFVNLASEKYLNNEVLEDEIKTVLKDMFVRTVKDEKNITTENK